MKKLLLSLLLLTTPVAGQVRDDTGAQGVFTPDRSVSGALGALNAAVTVNVSGRQGIGGYITTGSLSGTVTPEVTIDGTNWIATSVYTLSAGAAPARAATVTLNTLFAIELPPGALKARVRVSAHTSGTSTGTLIATETPGVAAAGVPAAAAGGTSSSFGSAFPSSGTAAGLSDGTNMRPGLAADLDSGAGAQYGEGVNLRKIASGGSVEAGTAADPLRTDPTGTTTQPVSAASLPLPTGAATSANQSTEITSLQKIDNLAHAGSDAALSEHVPISGQLDDTATTTVTENQVAPARITSGRALHVAQQGTATVAGTVTANAGSGTFTVGDGVGSLTVDGTVDTELPAAAALADNTANPTITGVASYPHYFDGSAWDRFLGNSTDGLLVNLGANNDVTVTGSVTANAGTNLNTSALALESGGNLATVAGLSRAEDAAHTSGQAGVMFLGVRKDSAGTLCDTDLDYCPPQLDASGALRVTGGGGGTEYTEDVAAPADPVGATFMMTRDDQLAAVTEIEGDWSRPRGTAKGALWVAIPDVNGDPITSFGGGTEYSQGTATTDTDVLKMAGAVRRDTAAVATGVVDGDRLVLSTDSVGRLRTTAADTTQPISAAALPLPTGAATESTLGTRLADATFTGRINTQGQKAMSASTPVVLASDQSALPTSTTNVTASNTLGALNAAVSVALEGRAGAGFFITGGTLDGTLLAEISNDGGTTWTSANFYNAANALREGTKVISGGASYIRGITLTGGVTHVRVRVSAYTSGSSTGQMIATTAPGTWDFAFGASDLQDNTAFTSVDPVAIVGGRFDDASPATVSEGNAGALRLSTRRELYGQIRDAAGNERGANVTAGNALVTDSSAVTQPISAASLPLPSGASTSANQSTEITSLQLIDDLPLAQGSTTSGQSGVLTQGAVTTSAPSYTTAQTSPLSLQTDGDLRVNIEDELPAGTQNIGDVDVASLPNEGQQTAANSISVTPDTDNDPTGTTGAAVPGEATLIAGTDGTNVTVPYIDPCEREARSVFRVDIVTATTTEIAAAVASEFYWICSVNLITDAANDVIIVEDDTATNCPSPTAGVSSGGTTAAEGYNFAANGGIVVGTGQKWVMKTTTANRSFCIITSAATQLSGTITYVSAP